MTNNLPANQGKVRILLADDHQIILDGLKSLFEKHPEMSVVAEARDGRSAVKCASELSPDIILMDVSMPDLNGIEATRQIVAARPAARVLILSVHSDGRFVSRAFEAGACGYLLKEGAIQEVIQAIGSALAGQRYLSPKIASVFIEDYLHHLATGTPVGRPVLTPHEIEVLQLLSEGKNTKQIAVALEVSEKTVEARRRRIMEKISADSMAELVKYAIREGLTTLE